MAVRLPPRCADVVFDTVSGVRPAVVPARNGLPTRTGPLPTLWESSLTTLPTSSGYRVDQCPCRFAHTVPTAPCQTRPDRLTCDRPWPRVRPRAPDDDRAG